MFGNALRPPPNRDQAAQVRSRPAPIGGWNARDALANMPPTDAVSLINWFPTTTDCMVRQGYSNWATGFPGNVSTVAGYRGSTPKLFGCSGGNIYDATGGGAIGAAVVSGLTSDVFSFTNFTTTGGTRYLCMFNGADSPRYWDGSAWTAITGVSTPAITGLPGGMTTADIKIGVSHKARLWLVRKASLETYYLPVGGVGGAAALFDLRPVFKRGGSIVAVETWSADTGIGLDDHLAFFTDQGEVAVYRGTDPSSASTWSLAGLYWVGSPVGSRPTLKYGGDVLVISQYGLIPISKLLQSVVINVADTLTDKIQWAISNVVTSYGSNPGWQITEFAKQNMLLLNVPVTTTTAEQYVMNTVTGAWCRWQGWNAFSWELYNADLYFGGSTVIAKAWDQYDDAGTTILTDLKCAFDYFDLPGQLKQFVMCRPILSSDGGPGVTYGVNIDYDDSDVAGTPSYVSTTSSTWDASLWDVGTWAGAISLYKGWQYLSGLGYSAAFRMKTASKGNTIRLSAIDYVFATGGIL